MKAILIAIGIAMTASLFSFAPVTHAMDLNASLGPVTSFYGGPNGGVCPDGWLLVGTTGWWQSYTNVTNYCRQILTAELSNSLGAPTWIHSGQNGGQCPVGYLAVGTTGWWSTYTDVSNLCRQILTADLANSLGATTWIHTGSGGQCPSGWLMTGTSGWWQTYTDVYSICRQILTPAPPAPTGLRASCNAAGTQATLSWSPAPGATEYEPRVQVSNHTCPSGWTLWTDGATCYVNGYPSTSISFATTPGVGYPWWIHSGTPIDWTKYSSSWFSCTPPPPTITVSRTPTTLYKGQSMTSSWSTTNATGVNVYCTRPGAAPYSSGEALNSGPTTYTWDQLWAWGWQGQYYCTWTATGPGGTATAQDNFNIVPDTPAPTATLTAISPVAYGARSTLTWSSTNATSCTATGAWSNSGTLSGSGLTNSLYANTTFGFQCTNSVGVASAVSYATVVVSAPPAAACTLPWGGTIASGSSVTAYQTSSVVSPQSCSSVAQTRTCTNGSLSGSYTYPSCSVSAAACTLPWGGTIASGVSVTAFLNPTATAPATCASDPSQTRLCTNGVLSGSYTNQNCAALNPTATISASPTRVQSGNHTKLTWTTTDVTSCTVTGTNGFSKTGTSGTAVDSGAITSQTTFTLSCNAGSPKSVVVNVVPSYQEF